MDRQCQGTFDHFLAALRGHESGIDPSKLEWYISNFERPVVRYFKVSSPGRIARDWATGCPVHEMQTVREYFVSLGVLSSFDPQNADCLRTMQYRSMNPWGFVGYQIGEAALIAIGYYLPARTQSGSHVVPRYYAMPLADQTWIHGRREAFVSAPKMVDDVVITDVNTWEGTFTGKRGVFSLEDLMSTQLQEQVIRDLMSHNLRLISAAIGGPAHEPHAYTRQLEMQIDGKRHALQVSTSGILAAAHLCGPQAVIRLLRHGEVSADEIGTSILDYLSRFGDFSVDLPALSG